MVERGEKEGRGRGRRTACCAVLLAGVSEWVGEWASRGGRVCAQLLRRMLCYVDWLVCERQTDETEFEMAMSAPLVRPSPASIGGPGPGACNRNRQ